MRKIDAQQPLPVLTNSAGKSDEELKVVVQRAESALTAYRELSGAEPQSTINFGRWVYWTVLKQVAPDIASAYVTFEEIWGSTNQHSRSEVFAAIGAFEQNIGDVDGEFFKVGIAVNALVYGGGFVMWAFFLPVVMFISAVAEAAGQDVYADDANLKDKTKQLFLSAKSFNKNDTLEVAVGGRDEVVSPISRELVAEERKLSRAQAETKLEALQAYVRDRKIFFHQVIWSSMDVSWIEAELQSKGVPPQLFDLRFVAFEGNRAALKLANLDLAEGLGFDATALKEWQKKLTETEDKNVDEKSVFAPGPGVVVEPLLGSCQGGDGFVEAVREIDEEKARLEVRKLRAETVALEKEVQRLEAKLAAGNLDPPNPLSSVTSVVMNLGDANLSPSDDSGPITD